MAIIFLKEADRGNPFLADKLSFDISNNWFSHLIHYVGRCCLRWTCLGTQACTQPFFFRKTFYDGVKTYFWH